MGSCADSPFDGGCGVMPTTGSLEFAVRPLRSGDEAMLSRFYSELSPQSAYFFEPYRDKSVEAMRTVVQRALEGKDLSLVVVDPNGRAIGHIFFLDTAKEVPHLGIGLLDEFHGRGLGSALFVYLIGIGRRVLGKRTIGLTVMKENRRACHVYRKYGFRVVRDVTFRTPDDSYEMWLGFDAASDASGVADGAEPIAR